MYRARSAFVAVVLALALSKLANAATPYPVPPPVAVPPLPADAKPQPVGFSKLVGSVEPGTVWATFQIGLTCVPPPSGRTLTWNPGDNTFDNRIFGSEVARELKAAGFVTTNDPDNLFQSKNSGESDLKLAGNVKKVDANFCLAGFILQDRDDTKPPSLDTTSGYIVFDIEWQLYSGVQDKILVRKETRAGIAIERHAAGNYARLIQGGIRENVRALLASDDFRSAVLAPARSPSIMVEATTPLALAGSLSAKPMKISDAVGGVVLVLSGNGHGSGFLVSSDGYIMTAQHVVGADKYVKIRWSDGLEGVGEVIRSDNRRDAALIKTDPRGRHPLALRREMPQPGDTMFAIGAPLDEKYQSTVTRGVASANRIMNGFSFIQSDVTISPGNSGGPLLNEKGEVVGLCDLTFRPDGAAVPTGINYFVPIDDALRFLSAEPR
jgi:serine protease Do